MWSELCDNEIIVKGINVVSVIVAVSLLCRNFGTVQMSEKVLELRMAYHTV